MKNPNHYGSVTKLKGKRRNPWMVREGSSGKQKPIGYAPTKREALIMLAEFNRRPINVDEKNMTVGQLYEILLDNSDKLSPTAQKETPCAWKHIERLSDLPFNQAKLPIMQKSVDDTTPSMRKNVKTLWKRLEQIAYDRDIIRERRAGDLVASYKQEAKRKPFTDEEVRLIMSMEGDPVADVAIVLFFTGFRIGELLAQDRSTIDFDQMIFRGGSKTDAGRDRVVPIHPRIVPVLHRLQDQFDGKLYPYTYTQYRHAFLALLEELGIHGHTIHETRHTVASKFNAADANQVCVDLILGHATQGSTGLKVYTHKTLEQLKETITLLVYS